MPKAVISDRIYLTPRDKDHHNVIVKELTYKIATKVPVRGGSMRTAIEIIKNYKLYTGGIISMPQGRLDLIPDDYEIVDKRIINPMPFPDPLIPLRPQQQEVYDKVDDSCFINALVGWGSLKSCPPSK